MSKLKFLDAELAELDRQHLRRERRVFQPFLQEVEVSGVRLLNFASNDYLGLAQDDRVQAAAKRVLEASSVGATASALVTGRTPELTALEERIAEFEGQDAAIVFPSGYPANVGTISALASAEDVIFCDRLNHASLLDGCRLSRARLRIYRHQRLDRLKRELAKSAGFRRRFIVTDSVFSMDGEKAPLKELSELSERFDASLIVDEAHATGLLGDHGRGLAEELDMEDRVAVHIGTLSKAIGTLGGFVAGSHELVDWLWNRARTQMFSTALPPSICAAAKCSLDIIAAEPNRRSELRDRACYVKNRLANAGIEVPSASGVPILPVILGSPERVLAAAKFLEHQGLLVAAIRHPTVPQSTDRLRLTLSALHKSQDIDRLIDGVIRATNDTDVVHRNECELS